MYRVTYADVDLAAAAPIPDAPMQPSKPADRPDWPDVDWQLIACTVVYIPTTPASLRYVWTWAGSTGVGRRWP